MPEVIIVGGGFSGLAMAVQLRRRMGMQDFLLVERSTSFGGVWANNRYPGVACDIPTAFYSLSFAQEYWTDLFMDGASIRDYTERIASKYHVLESNTIFQSEVTSASWNAMTNRWEVYIRDLTGKISKEPVMHTCKILVSAVGNLTLPKPINIPGQESFKGRIVHTGAYDETLDLKNKRVVVLGNGCTAQQLVTSIAAHVKHLTIFGPSRHWYLPRPTLPVPWLFDFLCKYSDTGKKLLRLALFAACEEGFQAMSVISGKRYRARQEKISKAFICKAAPAAYRNKMVPNFAFGAKRVVFDNGYLQTLHKANVDFESEHVQAITEDGVITQDGRIIPADVIIAATGFQAQKYLHSLKVTGQNGIDLQDHMRGDGRGISSYKGTFYSSFPNFCTLYGPNLGTGHSSAIFTSECQIDMVLKHMIQPVLQEEDVDLVTVRAEKEQEWQEWLRSEMKKLVD